MYGVGWTFTLQLEHNHTTVMTLRTQNKPFVSANFTRTHCIFSPPREIHARHFLLLGHVNLREPLKSSFFILFSLICKGSASKLTKQLLCKLMFELLMFLFWSDHCLHLPAANRLRFGWAPSTQKRSWSRRKVCTPVLLDMSHTRMLLSSELDRMSSWRGWKMAQDTLL